MEFTQSSISYTVSGEYDLTNSKFVVSYQITNNTVASVSAQVYAKEEVSMTAPDGESFSSTETTSIGSITMSGDRVTLSAFALKDYMSDFSDIVEHIKESLS